MLYLRELKSLPVKGVLGTGCPDMSTVLGIFDIISEKWTNSSYHVDSLTCRSLGDICAFLSRHTELGKVHGHGLAIFTTYRLETDAGGWMPVINTSSNSETRYHRHAHMSRNIA